MQTINQAAGRVSAAQTDRGDRRAPALRATTAATSSTSGYANRGYQVYAVNPNAETVEGDTWYPDLAAIPGGVEAVVIATRPATAGRRCVSGPTSASRMWMHRAFGAGSVSDEATEYGRAHGITVIDGGCPLMFPPTVDGGHRMMKAVCTLTGKVPGKCDLARRGPRPGRREVPVPDRVTRHGCIPSRRS